MWFLFLQPRLLTLDVLQAGRSMSFGRRIRDPEHSEQGRSKDRDSDVANALAFLDAHLAPP
jgi:hypothetical protein